MKQKINTMIDGLIDPLGGQWRRATKAEIEKADGRKDRSNPICKTASCLYLACSDGQILYVGETSKSIKRRFISDGSGSHKKTCSTTWYSEMTYVQFITFDEQALPTPHRKLMEQALSIYHKPKYYEGRLQPDDWEKSTKK